MPKNSIRQFNDRYDQQVTRLLNELANYDDNILNRKPANGGWSALQTAQHLVLSEELSFAYVQKKLGFAKEGKADFKRADWRSSWRLLKVRLIFMLPLKVKAPANLDTDKLPDYISLAHTRERWTAIRSQWNVFFNNLPDELADKAVFRHPLAGKMSWGSMCHFFIIHLNRHLNQIRRALK